MRCFISLELPEEITEEIVKVQECLKEKELFIGKFTEEENMHLTLKYLGDIDSIEIEEVKKRLSEIRLETFKAKIESTGFFSEKFIRILWLQLQGAEALQKEVDLALLDLFNPEKRFMSHITFARAKKVQNKKKLIEEVKNMKLGKMEFEAEAFFLMESELTSEGPKYTVLKRFNLK